MLFGALSLPPCNLSFGVCLCFSFLSKVVLFWCYSDVWLYIRLSDSYFLRVCHYCTVQSISIIINRHDKSKSNIFIDPPPLQHQNVEYKIAMYPFIGLFVKNKLLLCYFTTACLKGKIYSEVDWCWMLNDLTNTGCCSTFFTWKLWVKYPGCLDFCKRGF